MFMTLLAAFQVVLSKYSGQDDVVVGTDVANRNRLETEHLIGFFINQLVLRTDLSANPTFERLLASVRETTLSAYQHQDVPFEKLVEELQPERDLSRSPLFQVKLVLQNAPREELRMSGIGFGGFGTDHRVAKLDLTIAMVEGKEGVSGTAEYATELYEGTSIERLLGYVEMVAEAMVEDSLRPIGEVVLLSESQRHQALVEWNDTADHYDPHQRPLCVHQIFERQARISPDSVALEFHHNQLSYRQLNQSANQLASYLLALGIRPEDRVAICIDRSLLLVTAMLAVLKARAAHVPLDPAHPPNRLDFILKDSQARLLLSQHHTISSLSVGSDGLTCLDLDSIQLGHLSGQDHVPPAMLESLAYVIYTSGSTGQPKGVAIEHTALTNFILSMSGRLELAERDVMVAVTTVSFDISMLEIYLPLVSGARLVMATEDELVEGYSLGRLLDERAATLMQATPSRWGMLLEAGWAGGADKRILCGGEQLAVELANKLEGLGGEAWNMYGPTETTIWSSMWKIESGAESVMIGRPVENTQMYVVGEAVEAVPMGARGELSISGAGLARGYLNRADLTAEKFIPDPFGEQAGGRLYKTGDVARQVERGEIEYLGRRDNQVKVRGYRVELAEIEGVLRQNPEVDQAVVALREDKPGDRRLVGYVVWKEKADGKHLREYLRGKLPEYMIPSRFVELSQLPLTANGKLDRKALPAPEIEETGTELEQARTPVEEILSTIWGEVLGVESVGRQEDFFELGGHSLLATQVISRVREAFDVEVPLKALFESPTVAGLAEAVERERREGRIVEAPPIVAVGRDRQLPLSFAQQRLWFIHQLESDSTAYNLARAVRLRGELDLFALKQSLQAIAQRHEVLRTRFVAVGGQPSQVIDEPGEIELPVWDVSELEASEREGRAREVVSREARRGFDLELGPVWRAAVARLSDDDHVLMLTIHHIASDGWSTGVMVRELTALYTAYTESREAELPPLAIQYADYAVWQREWLQGNVLQEQIDYWRNQLEGAPALELPTDKPRPASASHQGAVVPFRLSAELTHQLRQVSRRQGVTMFMTLLAAFQVVLSKYSGQDDVVVGTDVANRNRLETEHLIGFFINQLVLRSDLSANPTFEQLLASVRETTLSAYQHQDVPFEKLVEELQPERDLSRSPLFQVKLVLQNAPRGELRASGVDFGGFGAEHTAAKFDITLSLTEGKGGVAGIAEYSTELFEPTTMLRMLGHLRLVLEQMLSDPQQEVSEISLLTAAQGQQLLVEWNDTATEHAQQHLCVHELFERQARLAPDAVAVAGLQTQLSYGRLNEEANRLAHHLIAMGVGPEVRVGLCMQRGVEMVIALMGVLKAGAAYVPMDPGYPADRLAYMLEDARSPVLVTHSEVRDKLPSSWVQCVELDTEREAINSYPCSDPEVEVTGENLAYMIYTSGSTGRPKGVLIDHQGIRNLTAAQIEAFEVTPESRLLQFASLSFDASASEVFTCLIGGGTLHLAAQEEVMPGAGLQQYLLKHSISIVTLPPSALWEEENPKLPALRTLVSAGEECGADIVERWGGNRRFINAYGPTEASVCATWGVCNDSRRKPLIGRALANAEIHLLGRDWQPVAIGANGQLHVGGLGVARGYHSQPELTAERFVPHPYSDRPGARLYRTGDIARYLIDGTIDYLGREDEQVKVRGYRIELAEVEAALRKHACVEEAVVMAREDRRGDKRLVAYVVWEQGRSVTVGELREHLRAKLPEYMAPSAFEEMSQLPLTPNGKVDRKALPAPANAQAATEADEARTPVEEILSTIWADVLDAGSVGRQEDFFELGGHSLLATQVISRVREAFNVEVPLKAMFERPTVAGLAEAVERERREGRVVEAPPIVAVSRDRQLPLSFAQQRLWFIHQLEPDSAAYNIPHAVRLGGKLQIAALAESLKHVAQRHEVLRTRFEQREGQPVQVIDEECGVEPGLWDLSGLEESQREQVARAIARQEGARRFDLERGPVWRAALVRLSPEDHMLLLTMHHIVGDRWAIVELVREFSTLYETFSKGEPSPLPDLSIQYADFAHWQREWLRGEVLQSHLSYWKRRLAPPLPDLQLSGEGVRPAELSHRGAVQSFVLASDLYESVNELGRKNGVTLFMTLLAVFNVLLSRYTGQKDLLIASPIAGRNWRGIENLIGFFINTLILRTDLSGDPSFIELLRRVREAALGAYDHQSLPFERLIEELQPHRDASRMPLTQIAFNLQNAPRSSFKASQLSLSTMRGDLETAEFDLALMMFESPSGLAGAMRYKTDLFQPAFIKRMIGHYEILLREIASRPHATIGELIEQINQAEKRQQLDEHKIRKGVLVERFKGARRKLVSQQEGRAEVKL